MSQATDIVLAGDGYMVAPGTYRRMSDGVQEGSPGRIVLRDFVGGQRRAIQLEAERGWDSEGVGSVLGGQGVEPWPYGTDFVDGAIATPSTTTRIPSLLLGDAVYAGIGRYLYRSVTLSTSSWAAFTQVADLGAGTVISALAYYEDKLAICCGDTKDIQVYNPVGGAVSTLTAGQKGRYAVGYANQLIYSDVAAGSTAELRMTTGGGIDSRALDSPIVQLALHGGKVAIATRSGLYLLGGKADATLGEWVGEPEPFFTHGLWTGEDDFSFLVSYGGKLYTWLAGAVMEWNPNGGANRQGWRATGVEGVTPFGATVAGPHLIVGLRNRADTGQLWAFDGSGWWLIEQGAVRIWPVSLAGAGGFDLLGFRSAATTYDLYRLVHRDTVSHAYRSQGSYTTSLLDAGAPNERKAWRSILASFASPEERGNMASADHLDLTMRYSLDGGDTWTTLVTQTVGVTIGRSYELGGALSGTIPESRHLQVEIDWDSVTDWAPTLTSISVEYERLGDLDRRRRWQLGVIARDRIVERDGARHLRDGREIVADLWQAWEDGITVPFRDLDYDVDMIERRVRVIGLVEQVPQPANRDPVAASQVTVTLLEV